MSFYDVNALMCRKEPWRADEEAAARVRGVS